jgi:nucleoside-diphosphate-sugar epimerase
MRVLITGGSGSLARYCLEELRAHQHEVTLFDRIRPEESPTPWSPEAAVVLGDLTSAGDCLRAVETSRAEAIIHLGAIPFASEEPERRRRTLEAGGAPPPEDETFRVNVLGTYYVADAARRLEVSTIVFASSMCVIEGPGRRPDSIPERVMTVPVDESAPLWGEQSYHLSKILGEETLRGFARAYGVRAVCMRMMWVYFPHGGAVQREMMHLGMPAVPPAPGTFAVWEYLDARDAAVAYRHALEAKDLGLFEPFFLATDRMCTEEHRELVPLYYPHLAAPAARMGPDDLILSIGRARARLGYAPAHSWRSPERIAPARKGA